MLSHYLFIMQEHALLAFDAELLSDGRAIFEN